MSSGYYSAVSGGVARMQAMDIITNNLSNVGTPGFKKSIINFTSYLDEARQTGGAQGINYSFIKGVTPDMSDGTPIETGSSLDIAIMGDGFFKIQNDDGFFYTRQGNFELDPDGFLITPTGHKVIGEGGPISLDTNEFTVATDGQISTAEGPVSKINLYDFENMSQLERAQEGVFKAVDGIEGKLVERPGLLQGRLEASNVNILQEMAQVVSGVRYFEAYQKVMKSYSELADKANQLGILT